MRNEYGRRIQYEPDGPIYDRPSEAEIHDGNGMVDPRNCDCLECLKARGEQWWHWLSPNGVDHLVDFDGKCVTCGRNHMR